MPPPPTITTNRTTTDNNNTNTNTNIQSHLPPLHQLLGAKLRGVSERRRERQQPTARRVAQARLAAGVVRRGADAAKECRDISAYECRDISLLSCKVYVQHTVFSCRELTVTSRLPCRYLQQALAQPLLGLRQLRISCDLPA